MNEVLADEGEAQVDGGLFVRAASAAIRRRRPVAFPRGHVIFSEGEPGELLYIVTSGKVKISRRSMDGRESLLTVLGSPNMFGELSIFDPGPRTSSASALTEVRAVAMDHEEVTDWMADRPEIADYLLRGLTRRLRRTNNVLTDLVFTDVAGRLARQLLDLAHQFGSHDGDALRVTHDLTQEELGQLIAASRETVNKVLSDFAQRGWIRVEGKSVVIYDQARLARRSGLRPPPAKVGEHITAPLGTGPPQRRELPVAVA